MMSVISDIATTIYPFKLVQKRMFLKIVDCPYSQVKPIQYTLYSIPPFLVSGLVRVSYGVFAVILRTGRTRFWGSRCVC